MLVNWYKRTIYTKFTGDLSGATHHFSHQNREFPLSVFAALYSVPACRIEANCSFFNFTIFQKYLHNCCIRYSLESAIFILLLLVARLAGGLSLSR